MQNPTEYIIGAITVSGCTERAEAESILAEHDALQLAKAIEAARGEYLTDATGDETDEAYNRGVADVIAAIGALGERKP